MISQLRSLVWILLALMLMTTTLHAEEAEEPVKEATPSTEDPTPAAIRDDNSDAAEASRSSSWNLQRAVRDFVPSEEIEVDKPVDFPTNI